MVFDRGDSEMARNEKIKTSKRVIIDASVITRWYLNEEWTNKALQLRHDYEQGKIMLIAPYLIFYEVGNALRYSKDLTQQDVVASLNSLIKLQIKLIYIDKNLIDKMSEIAFLNNITIYDSSYCAIAELLSCRFITGDERLKEKVNHPYFCSLKNYDYDMI
ncbi:MAG: PIN domain-containing protein [Promethearchaeota archaeon]|nr:MAG: PIN domain-containing protein [Candidatus Lokiarchaeota archaeon]